MRNSKLLLLVLTLFLSIGCAYRFKRIGYIPAATNGDTSSTSDCNVRISRNTDIASGDTVIGTMKIGMGIAANCSEDQVLSLLRKEACGIGADVIVLRDIREPDFNYTCYRATADFIRQEQGTGSAENVSTVEEPVLPDKETDEEPAEETENGSVIGTDKEPAEETDKDKEYYSDEAVAKRSKKTGELAALGFLGGVLGFLLGYFLISSQL